MYFTLISLIFIQDLESMQLEFRNLVLQLTPQQIIPTAIRYRIIKRTEQRDGSDLSDNILSVC